MTSPELNQRPLVALAPMDGFTDAAYRKIVRKLNPGVLLYSEFTSVNGIRHSELVRQRLDFSPQELPYFVQIFGREPELFAETVKAYAQTGITGIDINMGCPSKQIVKSDQGGALMKEPDLACRIVEACAQASPLPVSVKTRLGWRDASQLVSFCKGLESAGAALITIHGRTYKQAYRGEADWQPIYELKKSLRIPVVGNGDIKSLEEGQSRLSNLDGFMIGRASVGNPWVFWPQDKANQVTLKERVDCMMEHFQLLRSIRDEKKALVEFRKHITGYISGFAGAKQERQRLMSAQNEQDFTSLARCLA